MRLKLSQLKRIIREEVSRVVEAGVRPHEVHDELRSRLFVAVQNDDYPGVKAAVSAMLEADMTDEEVLDNLDQVLEDYGVSFSEHADWHEFVFEHLQNLGYARR